MKKISDFTPQKRNANKHTPYGLRLLEKSLREDGFIDAQTAAADGEIISGSARLEKAVEVFTDEDGQEVEPIIVHSDGKRPVIVIRDDIPNAEHPRARRLSVAANKIAQVDFDPDWALLKEWGGEDEQIKQLFSDSEWQTQTGDYLSLSELQNKYGDSEKDDFFPVIRIKVSPETFEKYNSIMKMMDGQDEAEKFDALISRVELS